MALAVFRLSELITREDGPYNVFSRFRLWTLKNAHKSQSAQTLADLVHCPYCLSMWLSFIILIVPEKIQTALGLAGLVSLLLSVKDKIEA